RALLRPLPPPHPDSVLRASGLRRALLRVAQRPRRPRLARGTLSPPVSRHGSFPVSVISTRRQGTHLGVYERRRITVVVDGASKEVEAQAYFANASYAEFLWLRCGGEAAEIAEYTMEHAGRYVPPSGRSPGVSGLMDAVRAFLATAPPEN
uniref:Uncharacterized protein n=1 Tax=Aegilops tauschii subsp. strangulata TaxID=200361 RepID=A0A453KUB2_AEGTS